LTDNFELGASTNINKTYINASLFARQTNNSISQIRVLSDTLSGALITTYQNIGKQQNYGANVFANIFITPKWSLNGGVDLLHTYLEGQAQSLSGTSYTTSNSGFVVSGRIMTSLSLTNGWGIQGFGFSVDHRYNFKVRRVDLECTHWVSKKIYQIRREVLG
jgi:outer membrane receptor protein involved in Fe transport